MRDECKWEEEGSRAHRFAPPRSSAYLLPVCDECLVSFWITGQWCWVDARWGPQRYVYTQWSIHPPRLLLFLSCGQWGQLQEHSDVKFNIMLCVIFIGLDKISQDIVKMPSPLWTHCLEKDRNRVRIWKRGCMLDDWATVGLCVFCLCATSPLLLEAWVSASFGVRKRSGSLSGLVPDMLMDWTCTM